MWILRAQERQSCVLGKLFSWYTYNTVSDTILTENIIKLNTTAKRNVATIHTCYKAV